VSKSWKISSNEKIWDERFIKKWDYIFIDRKTEMFSWKEVKHTTKEENYGWSETTRTTYTYEKTWSEEPQNSSYFYKKEWYNHPSKIIDSSRNIVDEANIEKYNFSTNSLRLPKWVRLSIKEDMLIKKVSWKTLTKRQIALEKIKAKILWKKYVPKLNKEKFKYPYTEKYIFIGSGSLQNPQIGDIKISYYVFNKGTFWTIFWKVENGNIIKYVHNEESSIYHLFDRDRENSIKELNQEYLTSLWLMRWVWFLMMWIGLMRIFNIFSTLLAIIPFLAQAWRFLIWFITLIIAVVLSLITIFIWIIAHNIFLLIWIIVLLIVVTGLYFTKYHKKEIKMSEQEDEKKY
jgi:hypothetical protein